MTCFEGVALHWFHQKDLKMWILECFLSLRKGTICGHFLTIKLEMMVEAYPSLFDKLVVLFSLVTDEVLENTYMNGAGQLNR